jgi:glucose/arabinose dehydrogenase
MRVLMAAAGLLLLSSFTSQDTQSQATRFRAQTIARRLEAPWSLAFAPDGRLFVTERPGRIRVIVRDSLRAEPWAVIPVHGSASQGLESGLMGLAVDPQFARTRRVYVCYTHPDGNRPGSNRIATLTEEQGKGTRLTVLLDAIPAGNFHNGCRLKFGPDGKLYATTGDATGNRADAGVAQDLKSQAGKVLRINPDGSVPRDNPFPGSYVWSYGHRNAQGLAWQPRTNRLFATEHGTGDDGNNEVNIIERGKNYGWPIVIGNAGAAPFVRPILVRPDAPAGATFVTGTRYKDLTGNLLIATIGTQRLLSVSFRPGTPLRILRTDVLLHQTYGRLRDVVQGPDGFLYIATSNRDGRGRPATDDDRVIRLVPSP